jgi:CubicO group peptidase (beta-lactamase class C family)
MKIIFVFCVLVSGLISCQQKKRSGKVAETIFDTAYQPATFTEKDRLQKISETFPLIDKIVRDYADSNHLPGVAYGLVVDGKLVYKGNIGYTDIEKKIPVTSSSLFRIASMSKSFTCMAILKLRDEGKLNLDDPAYFYIPELKKLKYPTADAPHISPKTIPGATGNWRTQTKI